MESSGRTALRNVRVFDGFELSEPQTVVIDGGIIGNDAHGAREIDAAGCALLPGLIDSHVHLHSAEDLVTLASWGVTTGLDMACWPVERVRELRLSTDGADFRTPGLPAIGPGGVHALLLGVPAEAIILSPKDARLHVERRAAEGVDYVKGVSEAPGGGGPPSQALDELVVAAREHGMKTIIHADSVGAFSLAIATGAEVITHLPLVGVIRPEDVTTMQESGQVCVPTVAMLEGILASGLLGSDPSIDHVISSLSDLHRAGVMIVAGTDSNDEPGAPFQVHHGESLHHEFELMARAGMSPVDILRSATILAAETFGLNDRGTIEIGKRADLLLVDGDPTIDISATRAIRGVWCAGKEISDVHSDPR